jgi:hypothetical protein
VAGRSTRSLASEMRGIVAIFVALVVAGCDTVTTHYATISKARQDRLFERGWLPDVLPDSSRDIRVANDLDTNVSGGYFYFSPDDAPKFQRHVTPGAPTVAPLLDWPAERERKRRDGFAESTYQADGSTWVFFCKVDEGYCEYAMWSRG